LFTNNYSVLYYAIFTVSITGHFLSLCTHTEIKQSRELFLKYSRFKFPSYTVSDDADVAGIESTSNIPSFCRHQVGVSVAFDYRDSGVNLTMFSLVFCVNCR